MVIWVYEWVCVMVEIGFYEGFMRVLGFGVFVVGLELNLSLRCG